MSVEVTRVGYDANSLVVSPEFDPITQVVVKVDDETSYTAGNTSGRTVTVENPFGTQAIAESILNSMNGYQYQPYTASGTLLDPAAELGDAIEVGANYGVAGQIETTFGRNIKASVSAIGENEIDHEIPSKSKSQRQLTRNFASVSSSISSVAGGVSANKNKLENISAGLATLVKQDETTGVWKATSTLYATIDDVSAQIQVEAQKAADGTIMTLASMVADIITLKSRITTINGAISITNGLVSVTASQGLLTGGLQVTGTSVLGNASCKTLMVDSVSYAASDITSTSGAVTVLGK